jgi:hypothetical protein
MIGAGTPEISDRFDSLSSEGILNAGAALLQPAFFVSEPKVAAISKTGKSYGASYFLNGRLRTVLYGDPQSFMRLNLCADNRIR